MSPSAAIAFATPRQAARIARCPCCDEVPAIVFRTRAEIAAELAMRDAFFARRLDRHRSRGELRDLTNVLLGTPADILRCEECGILIRDDGPDDEAFRNDCYERAVLDSLHAVHAVAFREKERDYRALLRSGARVQRLLRAPAIRPLRDALRSWAQEEKATCTFEWIEATFRTT